MAAADHLGQQFGGSDFSVHENMLHVQGKPYPLAQPIENEPPSTTPSWKKFRIPFESGHELTVGGTFDQAGRNVPYMNDSETFRPGLHALAHHVPTGESYKFKGRGGKPVTIASIGNADEFFDRIKEIGNLHGGGG